MRASPHCFLIIKRNPMELDMNRTMGIKKETQKSKSDPISENKLSQKVKPIHTVQDFAVCIGVAEIRKQVVDELINQWEVDANE